MRKIVGALSLFAAFAALTAAPLVGTAQEKKATQPKKADAKTEGKGPTVEIGEGKDGKFRFSVRDADGKYLGGSAVGYATKADAVKAVETLKAAIATAKVVDGKKAEKEKEKEKGDK